MTKLTNAALKGLLKKRGHHGDGQGLYFRVVGDDKAYWVFRYGFRILARKQGERVLLWSRRGADFTDRFHRIADAVRGLNADDALIDGEAVVFQDDGRSDFHALLTKRGWMEAAFVAFDILRLNAEDMRQRPLQKRRGALMRLIVKRHGDGILFCEALAADGAVVLPKVCELGLYFSPPIFSVSAGSVQGEACAPHRQGYTMRTPQMRSHLLALIDRWSD